jgi:molybdenum cofactor biosynthesis protein B
VNTTTSCFEIIVVSDRVAENPQEDVSGEIAKKFLEERGYCISRKKIIRNNYREILRAIREANGKVLVLLGGTGPSPRDITVDVVENIAWRCMPGFGELFRALSMQRIGYRAILSRTALCILHDGKISTVLPGSPQGVILGLEILVNIVNHLLEEVNRFEGVHIHEDQAHNYIDK